MITRQFCIIVENQKDWTLDALLNQSCMKATHCVNAEDPHGEPARVWAESERHAEIISGFLVGYGYTVHGTEEI